MNKIDFELLKNYTEGKYSLSDFKRLSAWFDDLSLRSDIELVIKENWDNFSVDKNLPKKDLNTVFNRIQQQILQEKPKSTTSFKQKIINTYGKVAAILLLPLLLFSVYTLVDRYLLDHDNGWAEIYSPPGARTSFSLPDGSIGWLNSNTKLKYSLDFKHNRQLELSGEAYFKAAHNKKIPFIVRTPNIDIKVLGTVFSVSALEEDNSTDVILEEGKVLVENPENNIKTELNPNQKLVFDHTYKRFQTTQVNAKQYNAWKDGLLIFRNEPLSEVFKRAGRWYNVKITVEDAQINQYKYRATFQDEPIEEVIRLIALTVPIEYKIKDRAQNAQGAFTMKEIIIKRKAKTPA